MEDRQYRKQYHAQHIVYIELVTSVMLDKLIHSSLVPCANQS